MGGTCISKCTPYIPQFTSPRHVIIGPNDYTGCGIPNPAILVVRIDRDATSGPFVNKITFNHPSGSGQISFTVVVDINPNSVVFINQPKGIQLSYTALDTLTVVIIVKLIQLPANWNPYYVPNDTYKIAVRSTCNLTIVAADIVFERQEGGKVRTDTTSGAAPSTTTAGTTTAVNSLSINLPRTSEMSPVFNLPRTSEVLPAEQNIPGFKCNKGLKVIPSCQPNTCDSIRVPQINITAQTTINGSDIGDAIFTVFDEFKYEDQDGTSRSAAQNIDNPIPEDTCMIRYIKRDDVKETEFRRCCPYMVSVIRGKGKTFLDRILSIYDKLGEVKIGVSFRLFYQNLALYGLSKYILSRLLYGDFNINYLLGKYNEKFLADLGASRFCGFIEFFEDCESPVRGYNKYFKY